MYIIILLIKSNNLWNSFMLPSLKASDMIGCIIEVVAKVIKQEAY